MGVVPRPGFGMLEIGHFKFLSESLGRTVLSVLISTIDILFSSHVVMLWEESCDHCETSGPLDSQTSSWVNQ